jgi:hypothetical protein
MCSLFSSCQMQLVNCFFSDTWMYKWLFSLSSSKGCSLFLCVFSFKNSQWWKFRGVTSGDRGGHNLWEVMWSPQELHISTNVEFALCAVYSLCSLLYDDLLQWERSAINLLGECDNIWWILSTLPSLNTRCCPECLLSLMLLVTLILLQLSFCWFVWHTGIGKWFLKLILASRVKTRCWVGCQWTVISLDKGFVKTFTVQRRCVCVSVTTPHDCTYSALVLSQLWMVFSGSSSNYSVTAIIKYSNMDWMTFC